MTWHFISAFEDSENNQNRSSNLQRKIWIKKAEKLLKWDKKMILMKYRNWSINWLYDRKSDSVVISKSIDFNEDLLTDENIKNSEIINQNSWMKRTY